MNIAFVILHYNEPEVTADCISCILKQKYKSDVSIVVVDNNSPDKSGKLLFERYSAEKKVVVLLNNTNTGFASGNNIGYKYVKNNLKADVIICLNNDIIIEDNQFVEKLENSSYLYSHEIIAPDVVNKEGVHQNPFMLKLPTLNFVKKTLRNYKILKLLYSIPFFCSIKGVIKKKKKFESVYINHEVENIVPHGSFVIFTQRWVTKEDFAFVPGTFMYGEELLLAKYCENKEYKTIYSPTFIVRHLEDISTNSKYKKLRKKAVFQLKNKIKSTRLLLDSYYK